MSCVDDKGKSYVCDIIRVCLDIGWGRILDVDGIMCVWVFLWYVL